MTPRDPTSTARAVAPPAPHPDGNGVPLPAGDPAIFEMSLDQLARHWVGANSAAAMTAAAMTGADRRAQLFGVPGSLLMEHAGIAAAAAIHALAVERGRWAKGPVLVLAGPGNNGGDGFVIARRLAQAGLPVVAVLVSAEPRPGTPDAARNWDRLAGVPRVTRMHAESTRELAIVGQGIEKASVVVDALLGTGVRGSLREPIRSAVRTINGARAVGVPVAAVDTPTAVDLTSGEPSDPVVRADLTVTFHRPKVGLRTRRGAALAGRVLVAPIGIPAVADRG
ncbi:MAG: NAD(P)H-hydrate epimerase [Chloroflexi bacterium]|nr:MAG: NAD(P)H-hydrate epimerase [Chloroflexota bacterium]